MKEHELKKWDKLKFENWVVAEYIKTDWMYSKWKLYNKEWGLINDWETFHLWGAELEKQWDFYVIKK